VRAPALIAGFEKTIAPTTTSRTGRFSPDALEDHAARFPCGRTPRTDGAKPPTESKRTDPNRGDP